MDVEKAGEQDTTDMGGCISLQGFGFWEREGRDKQQPHTWKLIRGGVKQNGPPLNFFRALIDHMHASSLISSLEAIDVEVRCFFFSLSSCWIYFVTVALHPTFWWYSMSSLSWMMLTLDQSF